jgi:hypothetical protein
LFAWVAEASLQSEIVMGLDLRIKNVHAAIGGLSVAAVASVVLGLLVLASDKTGSAPATESRVESIDGRLAMVVSIDKYDPDKASWTLEVALTNTSPEPLVVLKPLADDYVSFGGMQITGPAGVVEYRGPKPTYILGKSAFCELAPDETIKGSLDFRKGHFPGITNSGRHTLVFTYIANRSHVVVSPTCWQGLITSGEMDLVR